MSFRLIFGFWISLIGICSPGWAQTGGMGGFVEDATSGERLIGVRIQWLGQATGAYTNAEGFFSLPIANAGERLALEYPGYTADTFALSALGTPPWVLKLQPDLTLDSVLIVARQASPGQLSLRMEQIKTLPSLAGEPDALRAFQLLPGVAGGNEGTAALYVRGGSPDQNLVLLDDAPLYYINHVGGFLSIFDPNTIKQMRLIKGGFPARYGGRLSSVLEVYTKEGHQQMRQGNFHLGLLSGGVYLEGPLGEGKTTYLLSGRRSFIDAFTRVSSQLSSPGDYSAGYAFYDLNGKLTHRFSDRDMLSLSVYHGRDQLFTQGSEEAEEPGNPGKVFRYKSRNQLNWGNTLTSLKWQHLFHDRLHGKLIAGYTRFHFLTGVTASKTDPESDTLVASLQQELRSGVQDLFLRGHLDWYPQADHHLEAGVLATYHRFRPGSSYYRNEGEGSELVETRLNDRWLPAVELQAYLADTWQLTPGLSVEAGLHASMFQVEDTAYPLLQPRIQVTWQPHPRWQAFASLSRMQQPLHLLSNSSGGLPTDLWIPATRRIAPQQAWQASAGGSYQLDLTGSWHLSVEGFYKRMRNLVDFEASSGIFASGGDWQEAVVMGGQGETYGGEWLLEKRLGQLTGWVGYTLAWNWRQFEKLNQGERFPFTYDRRHDLSVVAQYALNRRVVLSATWTYASGRAITLAPGLVPVLTTDWRCGRRNDVTDACTPVFYGLQEGQLYPQRNNYRMPAYHRLDLGASFTQPVKKGERVWRLGLYNAYWRLNPYFVFLDYNDTGNLQLYQFSLFPILPSISYERSF